jgi:hypothetical protein
MDMFQTASKASFQVACQLAPEMPLELLSFVGEGGEFYAVKKCGQSDS